MAKKVKAQPAAAVNESVVNAEDIATLQRMAARLQSWESLLVNVDEKLSEAKDRVAEKEEQLNTAKAGRDMAVSAYNREIEWLRREHGIPSGTKVEFKDKDGEIVIVWDLPTEG